MAPRVGSADPAYPCSKTGFVLAGAIVVLCNQDAALADIEASLRELGATKELRPLRQSLRGGLVTRVYRAKLEQKPLEIVPRATPDGKLEQHTIAVE